MPIRQSDVARTAGVSQSTVSLVVSGRADRAGVAPATQERVRAVMDRLGYVPNSAARSLRRARNGLIGVHTYEPVFPAGPGDYYRDYLVGVEVAAAELGIDLVLFSSAQRPGSAHGIYTEHGNRLTLADGTIVLGANRDAAELRRLSGDNYPFVVVGALNQVPQAAWVGIDYVPAVHAVVADLYGRGHRDLVYVRTESHDRPFLTRRSAFREAVSSRGGQARFIDEGDLSAGIVRDWRDWGATAVVAEDGDVATTVARLAGETGVRIPDDLSAVCLNDPLEPGPAGHWSHLRIPKFEVGRRVVRVLSEILDGHLPRDHHELVACPPHDDTTLGPASARGAHGGPLNDDPARSARTFPARQETT